MIKNKKESHTSNITHICKTEEEKNQLLGFWIYLMSDCIIFAIIFSVYIIYYSHVSIHVIPKDFFRLNFVFFETCLLLFSSLSCGMMMISFMQKSKKNFFLYLILTFILGLIFICIEIYEFYELIIHNFGPSQNAFFSSFFTLVGLHGIHVFFGLIWILAIFYQVIKLNFTRAIYIRISLFSLFWHFLDIIWICVFTFVYLNGAM